MLFWHDYRGYEVINIRRNNNNIIIILKFNFNSVCIIFFWISQFLKMTFGTLGTNFSTRLAPSRFFGTENKMINFFRHYTSIRRDKFFISAGPGLIRKRTIPSWRARKNSKITPSCTSITLRVSEISFKNWLSPPKIVTLYVSGHYEIGHLKISTARKVQKNCSHVNSHNKIKLQI